MNPGDLMTGAAIGAASALLVVAVRLALVGITRGRRVNRPTDEE